MNGTDLVILAAVAVLLGLALRGARKHFRGEGPCCGGGGGSAAPGKRPSARRLDGPVIARRTLRLSGLHCAHCADRVARALNELEGVSATVDLNAASAAVALDREVEDAVLRQAVERAGYRVEYIETDG